MYLGAGGTFFSLFRLSRSVLRMVGIERQGMGMRGGYDARWPEYRSEVVERKQLLAA